VVKKLEDISLESKDVIVRVDFNIPINDQGQIIDDTRLKATLPTINFLLKHKCKIVLLSHLGRPSGIDPNLSLKKIIPLLEELTHQPIHFIDDLSHAKDFIKKLPYPSIVLLENLRFYNAEENPQQDPEFAKRLSSLGTVYVNDAFACAHRAHSSITEITRYFPHEKAAGFLLRHEIEELKKVLKPSHPFLLLLGGSKISSKIGIINSLLPKAEALLIGGAMAFPFMKALNISCGSVKVEQDQVKEAQSILDKTKKLNKEIYLPIDWNCKEDIKSTSAPQIFEIDSGIPPNYQAFDIGPKTVQKWEKKLLTAKTIFWNGPFGMYEIPPFDLGTAAIAKIIANLNCQSIVGGGDSVAAIEKQHLAGAFTHLSTGGGASLEFLENGTLPGIEVLN